MRNTVHGTKVMYAPLFIWRVFILYRCQNWKIEVRCARARKRTVLWQVLVNYVAVNIAKVLALKAKVCTKNIDEENQNFFSWDTLIDRLQNEFDLIYAHRHKKRSVVWWRLRSLEKYRVTKVFHQSTDRRVDKDRISHLRWTQDPACFRSVEFLGFSSTTHSWTCQRSFPKVGKKLATRQVCRTFLTTKKYD